MSAMHEYKTALEALKSAQNELIAEKQKGLLHQAKEAYLKAVGLALEAGDITAAKLFYAGASTSMRAATFNDEAEAFENEAKEKFPNLNFNELVLGSQPIDMEQDGLSLMLQVKNLLNIYETHRTNPDTAVIPNATGQAWAKAEQCFFKAIEYALTRHDVGLAHSFFNAFKDWAHEHGLNDEFAKIADKVKLEFPAVVNNGDHYVRLARNAHAVNDRKKERDLLTLASTSYTADVNRLLTASRPLAAALALKHAYDYVRGFGFGEVDIKFPENFTELGLLDSLVPKPAEHPIISKSDALTILSLQSGLKEFSNDVSEDDSELDKIASVLPMFLRAIAGYIKNGDVASARDCFGDAIKALKKGKWADAAGDLTAVIKHNYPNGFEAAIDAHKPATPATAAALPQAEPAANRPMKQQPNFTIDGRSVDGKRLDTVTTSCAANLLG